jgi:hypothetical protein
MEKKITSGDISSKIYCTAGALLFLAALIFFGAVAYTAQSDAASISSSGAALAATLETNQQTTNAEIVADATEAGRTTLLELAVPDNGGASFIEEVESIGNISGASTTIASVTATPPKGGVPGTLELSATFFGSFADCQQFVQLLETMDKSVYIQSLSLGYNDADKMWDGTLTIATPSFDTP